VEDDVVDIDALSVSDSNFVDQEEVRDGAPWLKCERQLLKTTDKDMILKGSLSKVPHIASICPAFYTVYGNTMNYCRIA